MGEIYECPDCGKVYKTYKRWYKHINKNNCTGENRLDVLSTTSTLSTAASTSKRSVDYYKQRIKELETQNMEMYAENRELQRELEAVPLKVRKHIHETRIGFEKQIEGLRDNVTELEKERNSLFGKSRHLEQVVQEQKTTIEKLNQTIEDQKTAEQNLVNTFQQQYKEAIADKEHSYREALDRLQTDYQQKIDKLRDEYAQRIDQKEASTKSEYQSLKDYYTKEIKLQTRRYDELVEAHNTHLESLEQKRLQRETEFNTRIARLSSDKKTFVDQCNALKMKISSLESTIQKNEIAYNSKFDAMTRDLKKEHGRLQSQIRVLTDQKNKLELEKEATIQQNDSLTKQLEESRKAYKDDFVKLRSNANAQILENKQAVQKSFEDRIVKLTDKITMLEAELVKRDELYKQVEFQKGEIRKLSNRISSITEERNQAQNKFNELQETYTRDKNKMAQAQQQKTAANNIATRSLENIAKKTRQVERLGKELEKLEKQLVEERSQYKNEMDSMKQTIEIRNSTLQKELKQIRELRNKNQALETQLKSKEDIEHKYQESIAERKRLETRIQELEKSCTKSTTSLDKIHNDLKTSQDECSVLKSRVNVLEKNLKQAQHNISTLEQSLDLKTKERDRLRNEHAELSLQHADLEKKTTDLAKQLAIAADKYSNLEIQKESAIQSFTKTIEEKRNLEKLFHDAETRLTQVETDLVEKTRQLSSARNEVDCLKTRYEQISKDKSKLETELQSYRKNTQKEVATLNSALERKTTECNKFDTLYKDIEKELESTKVQLSGYKSRCKTLELELHSTKQSVEKALATRDSLHTRISELSTANKVYEYEIDQAKKVIQSMEKKAQDSTKHKEKIQELYDQIHTLSLVQEKYEIAQRTISGLEKSKERLETQLYETQARVTKYEFAEKEVKAVQKELLEKTKALHELEKKHALVSDQYKRLQLLEETSKTKMEMLRQDTQVNDLRVMIDQYEAEITAKNKEIRTLHDRIDNLERQGAKLANEKKELQDHIKQIEEQHAKEISKNKVLIREKTMLNHVRELKLRLVSTERELEQFRGESVGLERKRRTLEAQERKLAELNQLAERYRELVQNDLTNEENLEQLLEMYRKETASVYRIRKIDESYKKLDTEHRKQIQQYQELEDKHQKLQNAHETLRKNKEALEARLQKHENIVHELNTLKKKYHELQLDHNKQATIFEQIKESEKYHKEMNVDRSKTYQELQDTLHKLYEIQQQESQTQHKLDILQAEYDTHTKECKRERELWLRQLEKYKKVVEDFKQDTKNKATQIQNLQSVIDNFPTPEKYNQLERTHKKLVDSHKDCSHHIEKLREQVLDKKRLIKETENLHAQIRELKRNIKVNETKATRQSKLAEDLIREQTRVQECQTEIGELKQTMIKLKQENASFTERIRSLQEKNRVLESAKRENTRLSTRIQDVESQLALYKQQLESGFNSNNELMEMNQRYNALLQKYTALEAKWERTKETLLQFETLESQLSSEQQRVFQLQSQLQEFSNRNTVLMTQVRNLTDQVSENHRLIAELQSLEVESS